MDHELQGLGSRPEGRLLHKHAVRAGGENKDIIHTVPGDVEEFFERDIFSEKISFNLCQALTFKGMEPAVRITTTFQGTSFGRTAGHVLLSYSCFASH